MRRKWRRPTGMLAPRPLARLSSRGLRSKTCQYGPRSQYGYEVALHCKDSPIPALHQQESLLPGHRKAFREETPVAPMRDIRIRADSLPGGCPTRTVGARFAQAIQTRTFLVAGQVTMPAPGMGLPQGKAPPPAGGWGGGLARRTGLVQITQATAVHTQ